MLNWGGTFLSSLTILWISLLLYLHAAQEENLCNNILILQVDLIS